MRHRSALCVFALACSGARDAPVAPASAATVLAKTFAPELVGNLAPTTPRAGDYAMALTLSFDTRASMEMRMTERRTGALRMTLASDGTAHACLGARSSEVVDGQYHYEPPERREHHEHETVQLLALAGTWSVVDGIAVVSFDHQRWGTCDVASVIKMSKPVTELRCIGITATPKVPAPDLACEASAASLLLELGMPLTTASRNVPVDPIHSAPSGRNLILGAPGVLVDVAYGSQAATPTITFRAGAVTLVETDYRQKNR